jgi:catechol 2,3-dioxygenase-like lactoylglutathione lyase family enzyme
MQQVIRDLIYVRFSVPDLQQQKSFIEDFGLQAAITGNRLAARGTDAAAFIYLAEQGEPAFTGIGFEASSLAALEAIAAIDGVAVEDSDLPGGGKIARLNDPSGHRVEVVWGMTKQAPLATADRSPLNNGRATPRKGERVTLTTADAIVKRLGHCVLMVKDFRESEAWYKTRFGLITSDEIFVPQEDGEFTLGAFMRCDRGDDYVDHHTLFLIHTGKAEFNHAAFEVADWDVLMKSHYDLGRAGYKHSFGVGKHVLGSQVFDYWKDPNGFMLEHFTDGDLFNVASGSFRKPIGEMMGSLWGPDGGPGQ